jgi:hypothetical protein
MAKRLGLRVAQTHSHHHMVEGRYPRPHRCCVCWPHTHTHTHTHARTHAHTRTHAPSCSHARADNISKIFCRNVTLRPLRISGPSALCLPLASSHWSPRVRPSLYGLLLCHRVSARSVRPRLTSGPAAFALPITQTTSLIGSQ